MQDSYRPFAKNAKDVETELLRLTEPVYADGISEPRASDVDAAEVAQTVHTQGPISIENPYDLSTLWIYWGQFLDHDIDLTPEQEGPDAELLKDDPIFFVTRSEFIKGTGEGDVPREHPNVITSVIDASTIYGSDLKRALDLRTGEGGKLKVNVEQGPDGIDLLPTTSQITPNPTDEGGQFEAGDIRASENIGLTSLQTVFVNEHNYWAERFAAEDPSLSDEELFQKAREVIQTLIQKITYEEFLPILLGDELPEYTGYNPDVSTQISTEFSTAAFRFGHTAIPDSFTFINEDGSESRDASPLFDQFFNDQTLYDEGTGTILRGLLEEKSQNIDAFVVDSLNNLLFTPDGGLTGFSLPERNILRGRDHGLDTYLNVREAVVGDVDAESLQDSTDFSIITSDKELQERFASVYETVGEVDLWSGIIAEDHAPAVTIGVTGQAILVDQFTRLRDGDPYFYLNQEWEDEELWEEVLDTQLSDVLTRSGGVDYVQRDALLASDRQGGGDGNDRLIGDEDRDLLIGFGGNDHLDGRRGDDDLFGGSDGDNLFGRGGSDGLNGEEGNDELYGGAGDDYLIGGTDNDILTGGRGDDYFVFNYGEEGYDTITDFGRGGDEDWLLIKGFGASEEDITLQQQGSNVEVAVKGTLVAELEHVDVSTVLGNYDLIA